MTWEIAFVFLLLGAAFASFVWEKVPPDVTAIALFAVLLLSGIVPTKDLFAVFANPAPITVAAMFILSAALVKCGLIDRVSHLVEHAGKLPYPVVIFIMVAVVAVGIVIAGIAMSRQQKLRDRDAQMALAANQQMIESLKKG